MDPSPAAAPPADARIRPPGRLERTVLRWLLRASRVTAVTEIEAGFRLLDLEGEALRDVEWSAGQKVQVSIGAGMTARTFSPISWDPVAGRTRLVVYTHSPSPAKAWCDGLRAGDPCQFFGPRASTVLDGVDAPITLFGDETSFGLAAALRGVPALSVFEVTDPDRSRSALQALEVAPVELVRREAQDAHLRAAEALLCERTGRGDVFVLTGKASSVQRLSRALKLLGVPPSRVKSKAYWATGKTGLD